ncbi:MAG: MBL fold metallo-hydrolase [Halolamina sp.]
MRGWSRPVPSHSTQWNVHLVDDGEVALVDAVTPGSIDDLRAELADTSSDAENVDRVLVTRFELDHVGGSASLAAR